MRKQRRRLASQYKNVTEKLISAFVFVTCIVQSLFFLNQNFQAFGLFLWLYRPVCVRPGLKSEDGFSHVAAHMSEISFKMSEVHLQQCKCSHGKASFEAS